MGELSERDLEQVAGGAELNTTPTIRWKKKNCSVCTYKCNAFLRLKMLEKVVEYNERGEEWICPNKK